MYAMPVRPQNPSALEIQLYNFELMAREHYRKRLASNPNCERTKKALSKDIAHLEKEKNKILKPAEARAILAAYRGKQDEASLDSKMEEKHQPTRILQNNLRAAGELKPSAHHEAHHIICGKGRWDQAAVMRARLNLHINGIGINDAKNGVWLFGNRNLKEHDWATPESPSHKVLHTKKYEVWLGENLGRRDLRVNRALFLNELRITKILIKEGNLPTLRQL
ncbi:MAG: AHH domain-containing protein [Pseudoalteromonas sp.]|uniref:AHH domain-containing protein n=1 Tax=Pseudoalteromonas sp. TaxID=53249 RepID=UPI0025D0C65B|nr:AHH domain-containing protein [Pseudoalteromonas sp.]MCH2089117.1 AHH domain-containing protein [Pseudoalteromonas sp.]